jgi:hypothetical protein
MPAGIRALNYEDFRRGQFDGCFGFGDGADLDPDVRFPIGRFADIASPGCEV